jgi:hypothetical protein
MYGHVHANTYVSQYCRIFNGANVHLIEWCKSVHRSIANMTVSNIIFLLMLNTDGMSGTSSLNITLATMTNHGNRSRADTDNSVTPDGPNGHLQYVQTTTSRTLIMLP